jgi:hypothetical protein
MNTFKSAISRKHPPDTEAQHMHTFLYLLDLDSEGILPRISSFGSQAIFRSVI